MSMCLCMMRDGLEKVEGQTATKKGCNANNAGSLVGSNVCSLCVPISVPVHRSLLNSLLACVC